MFKTFKSANITFVNQTVGRRGHSISKELALKKKKKNHILESSPTLNLTVAV